MKYRILLYKGKDPIYILPFCAIFCKFPPLKVYNCGIIVLVGQNKGGIYMTLPKCTDCGNVDNKKTEDTGKSLKKPFSTTKLVVGIMSIVISVIMFL